MLSFWHLQTEDTIRNIANVSQGVLDNRFVDHRSHTRFHTDLENNT